MKENNNFNFEKAFETLLMKGTIEEEREVVPGFKVKLRPLSSGESINAESLVIASNPLIPADTILKIRSVSRLSKAIISINNIDIIEEDWDREKKDEAMKALYKKLMDLPGSVIDEIYEFFIEVSNREKELYSKDLNEKIENF